MRYLSFESKEGISFINSLHLKFRSSHCLSIIRRLKQLLTLNRKWSFPLRISSVNVTKSAVSCWFGHIYWRILNGKFRFLCFAKVSTRFLSQEYLFGNFLQTFIKGSGAEFIFSKSKYILNTFRGIRLKYENCSLRHLFLRHSYNIETTKASLQKCRWKYIKSESRKSYLSLRLEGEETLKYRHVCRPPCGKVWYSKQRPWTHARARFSCFGLESKISI